MFRFPLFLASLVFLQPFAGANDACQSLLDQLNERRREPANISGIYLCGPDYEHLEGTKPSPVNGCLVEIAPSRDQNYATYAFQDLANQHIITHISGGFGWTNSGNHLCADVKTYVSLSPVGEDFAVRITRQTALDMLFCPFARTFTSYTTTCYLAE